MEDTKAQPKERKICVDKDTPSLFAGQAPSPNLAPQASSVSSSPVNDEKLPLSFNPLDSHNAIPLNFSIHDNDLSLSKPKPKSELECSGVPTSIEQAYRWHHTAAEQGDPLGAYYIAHLKEPDLLEDASYRFQAYQLAAEAGNALAHYYLGRCFETGRGVTASLPDALHCFQRAAPHHSKAQAAYERLRSQVPSTLTPLSIAKVQSGEFKKTTALGGGGQGDLYQDYWQGELVAVKHLHPAHHQDSVPLDEVQRQIQQLSDAKTNQCEYLMQIKAWCKTPPCIVLEYLPGHNLTAFLKTHPDLSWLRRYRLAHDILQGLAYLHQGGLFHRDLKSDNIMVLETPRLHTKLCDFDSLKKNQTGQTGSTGSKLTPLYSDPELLDSLFQSTPSISYKGHHDIYSVGWVLWEIATGKAPVSIYRDGGTLFVAQTKKRLIDTLTSYPQAYAQLIQECWQYPAVSRPGAASLAQRVTELLEAEQVTLANTPDEKGRTPLMRAICHGTLGKVATLLACKAQVNHTDAQGWTPLFWAEQHGSSATRITRLLLDAKADPTTARPKTDPAVLWARKLREHAKPWDEKAPVTPGQNNLSDPMRFSPLSPEAPSTYETLTQRMVAGQLSLAVQYRFMNFCYRYWLQHLPASSEVETAQETLACLKQRWRILAGQRLVYREVEEHEGERSVRYYWANSAASTALPKKTGVFYLCYPSYEFPPQSPLEKIPSVEPIEDPLLLKELASQEQAERLCYLRLSLCNQIKTLSDVLHQAAPPAQRQLSDYQIATVLYQRGYIQAIPASLLEAPFSAVYYFSRLAGAEQLAAWRQQPPLVSAEFIEAVAALRDAIDQALLRNARLTLFQERYRACSHALAEQLTQALHLRSFYRLQREVFALQTVYPEAEVAQRQALLSQLAKQLNDGEYFDRYRQAVSAALTQIGRSTSPDWTLSELTEAVLTTIRHWHGYGRTSLAHAQLRFYRQALHTQHQLLSQKLSRSPDETTASQQQGIAAIQHALTQCDPLTELLRQPADPPSLPVVPASQWSRRAQLFQDWHQQSKQQWEAKRTPQEIQSHNVSVASDVMQQIACEAETQLGEPPCAFTLLGLGSYSRGETSFCSDVDFALLIADAGAKQHPYFREFLALLVYKAADFPQDVLPLETKELQAMQRGECWIDTPAHLLAEHCFLPEDEKALGGLSDRSYPLRWPKSLHHSQHQAQAAQRLWHDYQQGLHDFFHQKDSQGTPYYRRTEAWCLQQHLKTDVLSLEPSTEFLESKVLPSTSTTLKETKETKEAKEIKETKEIKEAHYDSALDPSSTQPVLTATLDPAPLKTVSLKAVLYPMTHAVLSWGRYTGALHCTETQALLDHLEHTDLIPQALVQRLRTAILTVQGWRLRQHWAWLQADHPAEVQLDEVFLWPDSTEQQKAIRTGPRGFYLDGQETAQLHTLQATVVRVISESVAAFLAFSQTDSRRMTPLIAQSPVHERTKEKKTPQDKELKYSLPTADLSNAPVADSTTQTAPRFHPLAAAVEVALARVTAVPHAKANEAALMRQQAQQQADVRWLAQVMAPCAEELPPLEPRKSDPLRVKTDPVFRRHWRLYWDIPLRWRDLYLRQLRQLVPSDTALVEELGQSPSYSGWRWCMGEEEAAWSQSLRLLTHSPPQVGDIPPSAQADIDAGLAVWLQWIENHRVVSAPLKPEYASALFDRRGWKPKPKDIAGNHAVYCLGVGGKPRFWLKRYPEQPSTDYVVTALDRRLGIRGTPMQQLVAVRHAPAPFKAVEQKEKKGKNHPGSTISHSAVLVTAHVADAKADLHTVLEKKPSQLNQLDFLSFARTLVRVLLTNPEDDKGNDYFLVPLFGTDRLQLIRIDNERAFFPATHLTPGLLHHEQLQVKSILYCLDHMRQPWDSTHDPRLAAFLDELRHIQPAALIADLLNDLNQRHQSWQELFPEHIVAQHARCQEPWLSLPVLLLPEGLETSLLKRLTALQTALRLLKPDEITGLKLLEVAQPRLAKYYQSAFQKHPPQTSAPHQLVLTRFARVAGAYYTPSTTDRYRTSQLSGPQLLSRQLSMPLPALPKTTQDFDACSAFAVSVWRQQAHSVMQALEQTQHWQHIQGVRVKEGLLKLRPEASVQFALVPAREQQVLLEQLLQQDLSVKQQEFLLTTLVGAQCHALNLQAFKATLTDERLLPILKEAGQLIALDVSGCTRVTVTVLEQLSIYCPHLKRLRCHGVSWEKIHLRNFPHLVVWECTQAKALTEVGFSQVPRLHSVNLSNSSVVTLWGEAPQLHSLQLNECQQLRHLGRRSVLQNWSLRIPCLEQLQIDQCAQLQSIHVPAVAFFSAVVTRLSEAYPALTQVDLTTDRGGVVVPDFLMASLKNQMKVLDYSGDKMLSKTQFQSLMTYLAVDRTVTRLNLQANKIGAAGVQALAELLKTNTTLASLDLGDNTIGATGAQALAELLKTNTTLAHLGLRHAIGDVGAQTLAKTLKTNTRLTSLDLGGNAIGATGAQALAELLKTNTTLTRLELRGNGIGATGAQALAELLKTNTTLASLDLGNNEIGATGAQALAELLKTNTTLTNLDLGNNKIGATGAQALAETLKTNTTLTWLDLWRNAIGDAGAQALVELLKTNTTLTSLDLGNNEIGATGAQALAELLKTNTTLTSLDLRITQ